ncbi:MAG: lipoprotein-releasing ABC transporter permease subunit [Deltaproteobacteria bacterium]|nr:lipoprotein-releasing ABC transporter permease subunit [Deltaproteobacteria bacterium]
MAYELFIGLRYLKAKRKQTFISVISLISVLGIMVGVTALIIVLSVMTGFEETLREKILGINAHVVVVGFGGGIKDYAVVAEEVRNIEGVVSATPFTYNQALISASGGSTGAVIRGVDLKTAGDVIDLPSKIKDGSLDGLNVSFDEAGPSDKLPGIVLGKELARNIGARTGVVINVISPTGTVTPAGPMPRTAAFRVSGVFEIGMYEYDSNMAFISLDNAMRFFRTNGAATGVEVKLADIYAANKAADKIVSRLKGAYWARTWMEMNRNLFSALRLEKTAMFIILALIILVAAMNIISTLIMVVMEKGKDIAILKSLGATRGGIMKIFVIEGAVIGAVGTFLGAAMGVAGALNLEKVVGIIERLFNFKVLPPSVYYIDKLPSKVEPMTVALIVAVSLSITLLATLYPSWQASKLDPVESLRYE